MKIAIQTLGCKVNQSESSSIEGILKDNNFDLVGHKDDPDILIVNTCTVTAKSDYQSRQFIRKAIRNGTRVIATGCYAQLRSDELSKIEGLDMVVGNADKLNLISHLNNLSNAQKKASGKTIVHVSRPDHQLSSQPYYSNKSRAFLKLQDGCNSACSYCTIPLARGESRSLAPEAVLRVVDQLSSDGYLEIVLTGIHIGCYGLDLEPRCSLLDILNEIVSSFPHIRFRLSSIDPQEFKEEFLELIEKGGLCAHLHIPLQSGSDRILNLMNRGYSRSYYKQLINRILTINPDLSIGTDIITGFPGESENEFNETVKFVEHLGLSYFHVFPYSKRPDTMASKMSDHVDENLKKIRVKQLMNMSNRLINHYKSRQIGSNLDVIVEKKNHNLHYYNTISDNYVRVLVDSKELIPGQRIKIKVNTMTDGLLFSEPFIL